MRIVPPKQVLPTIQAAYTLRARHRFSLKTEALLKTDSGTKAEWSQDTDEITLRLTVKHEVRSKSVQLSVHPTRLDLTIDGGSIVSGSLEDVGTINLEGCYWFMDDTRETDETKCLTLVLQKATMGFMSVSHLLESDVVDTTITHHVFASIQIDGRDAGVLLFGLFGKAAPAAVGNFLSLVNNSAVPNGNKSGGMLVAQSLQDASFTSIYPTKYAEFEARAGESDNDNSHVLKNLKNEKRGLKHDQVGLLSVDPEKRVSEIVVTLNTISDFDHNRIVFGQLTYGMELLTRIESLGDEKSGSPSSTIVISSCGEVGQSEKEAIIKTDKKRRAYDVT